MEERRDREGGFVLMRVRKVDGRDGGREGEGTGEVWWRETERRIEGDNENNV